MVRGYIDMSKTVLIVDDDPTQRRLVQGVLEREGEVVHLIAKRLVDHSAWLGDLKTRSRDFH